MKAYILVKLKKSSALKHNMFAYLFDGFSTSGWEMQFKKLLLPLFVLYFTP